MLRKHVMIAYFLLSITQRFLVVIYLMLKDQSERTSHTCDSNSDTWEP